MRLRFQAPRTKDKGPGTDRQGPLSLVLGPSFVERASRGLCLVARARSENRKVDEAQVPGTKDEGQRTGDRSSRSFVPRPWSFVRGARFARALLGCPSQVREQKSR